MSAKVGKKFVDFSMNNSMTGTKTKLKDIAAQGKPVVVVVYSSETVDSAPALQALEDHALSHKHIEFVALNVEDDVAATRAYIQEQGIRNCLCFNGKIPKGYDIQEGRLPYHIVLDESGKVLLMSEDAFSYIDLVK